MPGKKKKQKKKKNNITREFKKSYLWEKIKKFSNI